jgi:hypothetical protein
MIIAAAQQSCSLGFTIEQALLSGLLGGFGFILNMLLVSGVVFAVRKYKERKEDPAVIKVVKDMLAKK